MNPILGDLLLRLTDTDTLPAEVIRWGAPVPSFGDSDTARIATLGLNPSNREFVDDNGLELTGEQRRFHTLRSLQLSCWSSATRRDIDAIAESLKLYFERNPYDRWFKSLEFLLGETDCSYYQAKGACHLDLVPFATREKWGGLDRSQKASLLEMAGSSLGQIIKASPIQAVVLNGRSVVDLFEQVSGVTLTRTLMPQWSLPRKSGAVTGVAYQGAIERVLGVDLGRSVVVLGYNHNIQSSFGVTRGVRAAIRAWLGLECREAIE